jgi:D-glycero-D-manno-heptose 1,7-bisphosphate phosphatase
MKQAAIFLDRDNTMINDPGYLADPNQVELLNAVPDAIRRFNGSGYKVVVVTNQSGVARGLLTEAQLEDIHAQLELLLEESQARLDAVYYCPYLDGDDAIIPKYRRKSHLRKPEPGMLHLAAKEHDLDLEYSWMIGDSSIDVEAGRAAGCRTILVDPGGAAEGIVADYIVNDLGQAAQLIIDGDSEGLATSSNGVELTYPEPDLIPATAHKESEPAASSEQTPTEARDSVLETLQDIRQLLQRQQRDTAQTDFSLARLSATLFQFLSISLLLWGLFAFIGDESGTAAAVSRFVLAGVVQLIALTLFLVDRGR